MGIEADCEEIRIHLGNIRNALDLYENLIEGVLERMETREKYKDDR